MINRTIKSYVAGSLILSSVLFAGNDDTMAKELMKLRAEVEQLNTKIQDVRESTKATMRSLIMEKNDLEANIAREDLKIKQLEQEVAKLKKHIIEASKNSEGIKPIVLEAVNKLEKQIKSELPFKTEDRVQDVARIREEMQNGIITPQKALAQIWNSYADEIRLTKENGIFKQTIKLDNEEKLAEIARLGMVMLYFRTPDDRVGFADQDANGWYYKEIVSKEKKELIINLFDSMHKQIRTGFFTLPNAIADSKVQK